VNLSGLFLSSGKLFVGVISGEKALTICTLDLLLFFSLFTFILFVMCSNSYAGRATEHPVSNNLFQSTTSLTLPKEDQAAGKSRSRLNF